MNIEKFFKKTHYESAWRYLQTLRPEIFTPEMFASGSDPTYDEFCLKSIDSIRNMGSPAQAVNYLNIYFHIYHMKQSHEKIYYVTPELCARLAQTSINVDSYFLKSPFREIYVQISPDLFYINDISGVKVPVHGFYIHLRDFTEYKKLRVMACSLMEPTPDIPFNDANFYFQLELRGGKLNDEVKRFIKNKIEPELGALQSYDLANNIDHLEEFTVFVFNVLLYITSRKPALSTLEPFNFNGKLQGLKSEKKKKKLLRRAERANTHRIIVIGEGVQDKNNDMESIRQAGGVGKWKLKNKVHVSGHWKTQWYGSEKKGTRHAEQIFIDDYVKGPDFTETISSKFVVK